MIRINLLPAETGKRAGAAKAARGGGPSAAPFYLLLALLYIAALGAGYYVYSISSKSEQQVAEVTKTRDKLKADVAKREKEFQAMNLLSQEVEEKYAVVQALGPENRVYWSEKVNMIAMARLKLAVYVTKLQLEEKIDERETPDSVKRREEWRQAKEKNPKLTTPEPKIVKQPVINQTLVINAIAYGNDSAQRLRQVNSFMGNLRTLKWKRQSGVEAAFVDRLAGEFEQLPQKVGAVGGVDVLRFGFRITAEPQLDRTSKNDPAKPDAAASTTGGKS